MEPAADAALVFTGGRLVAPGAARVSPFDHGFLYGESVFETLKTVDGAPLFLDRHLDRLARSAGSLGIPLPDLPDLRAVARGARERLRDEVTLRIVVTRGAGPVGVDPARVGPSICRVLAWLLVRRPPWHYARGVAALVSRYRKVGPASLPSEAKTGNFLPHLLAAREARAGGADEAILLDDRGRLVEGATSNLFWAAGGVLVTPSLATGCLPGITRDILLALARRAGIAVRERATGPEALRGASEAFLTNSTGGVIPVRSVGGRRIGARCPGPLTTTLATAYDEEIVIDSLRRGGS